MTDNLKYRIYRRDLGSNIDYPLDYAYDLEEDAKDECDGLNKLRDSVGTLQKFVYKVSS